MHPLRGTLKQQDETESNSTIFLTELQKHTNSTGKAKLLRLNNTAIASQKLSFHEEQGYKLEITPNEITISSPSDVGLFYGLQTLQQLCFSKKIACQVIEDAPKYDYRGWMLDCSRHFFSKEFIYKQNQCNGICLSSTSYTFTL